MPRPSGPPVGLSLSRTAKQVSRAFDDALTEAGGSLPTWLIMISLKSREPGTQRELASAVGIQGATLTHHLAGMERDGLVSRHRDPRNRRVQRVELTARGEQLFHRLAEAAAGHDRRLRAGFDETEIAALERMLRRMRDNVSDPPRPAPA
jgi:MarR family transcriptional regulator for hemolysin